MPEENCGWDISFEYKEEPCKMDVGQAFLVGAAKKLTTMPKEKICG